MAERITRIVWGVQSNFKRPAGLEDIDEVFGEPYEMTSDMLATYEKMGDFTPFREGRFVHGRGYFGFEYTRVYSGSLIFQHGGPVFDAQRGGHARCNYKDNTGPAKDWTLFVAYMKDRWGMEITEEPNWMVTEQRG